MKILLYTSLFLLLGQVCYGQCDFVTSLYQHDLEDMTISHLPDMTLYSFNYVDAGFALDTEEGPRIPIIYQGGIWMGGVTEQGQLRVSARAYDDFEDYAAGPLDDQTGGVDSETCDNWDQFFQVTYQEVEFVKADYEDDGIMNEIIPDNVLYYPGIGNPVFEDKFGFALPLDNIGGIAPFFDRDGDLKYDATKGDYPQIRGSESAFWVSNDRHPDNEDFVGMELLVSSNVNTEAVELAFSSQMKIRAIYHNEEPLKDFYLGVWLDVDLGCLTNDMVGSLPDSNMVFYYGEEQVACQEGVPFEAGTQPLLMMKYGLNDNEKISSFISYNRVNVSDELFPTTDPKTKAEVYNGLRGRWRDGTALTYGNEGYNIGSTDTVKFHYSHHDGAEPGPWKACESDPLTRDKRILVNFGPFNIEKGDIFDLNFSVHLLANAEMSCPTEEELVEACQRLETVISSSKEFEVDSEVAIYPNPFTGEITFETEDSSFDRVVILDLTGQKVYDLSILETNVHVFNGENLSKGVYIVQIYNGNHLISSKKIVKTL